MELNLRLRSNYRQVKRNGKSTKKTPKAKRSGLIPFSYIYQVVTSHTLQSCYHVVILVGGHLSPSPSGERRDEPRLLSAPTGAGPPLSPLICMCRRHGHCGPVCCLFVCSFVCLLFNHQRVSRPLTGEVTI